MSSCCYICWPHLGEIYVVWSHRTASQRTASNKLAIKQQRQAPGAGNAGSTNYGWTWHENILLFMSASKKRHYKKIKTNDCARLISLNDFCPALINSLIRHGLFQDESARLQKKKEEKKYGRIVASCASFCGMFTRREVLIFSSNNCYKIKSKLRVLYYVLVRIVSVSISEVPRHEKSPSYFFCLLHCVHSVLK